MYHLVVFSSLDSSIPATLISSSLAYLRPVDIAWDGATRRGMERQGVGGQHNLKILGAL